MTILIPMAGLATRFAHEGILTPKPLIEVAGKPLIQHTLDTLGLPGRHVFVTRTYERTDDNVTLSATLAQLSPGHREIILTTPTRGAVETCLAAIEAIDPDAPLIITNCDQRTEWDAAAFLRFIAQEDPDGAVVTHKSSDPKHSYAAHNSDGTVCNVAEKRLISSDALVGIHYWREGSMFINSARTLLTNVTACRECYVSETYNHLIAAGLRILSYRLPHGQYIPLGTPYDVAIYEGKLREYGGQGKARTILLDLDGTILKHAHRFSDLGATPAVLLPGVRAKLDQWDSEGHCIVLCTARKESARAMTVRQLEGLGVPYDQLIMGLSSGPRVLINDKLTGEAPDRAEAVNVLTDGGLASVEWKELGL